MKEEDMKKVQQWLGRAAILVLALGTGAAHAASFYPISGISSNVGNFFPVSNLIEGPGAGFDASPPHDQTGSTWVTNQPCYPCDYYLDAPTPVLTLDLGQDRALSGIGVWNYRGHPNGVSQFSLRFATSADGFSGFGTSIGLNPTYGLLIDGMPMQSFAFGQTVSARYVEFTALDNYFDSGDPEAGGDRVGLGEIAFMIPVPEPESCVMLLAGLALTGFIARRRKQQAG